MKPRQDSRWPDAHTRLKKLYESRAPEGMTQEQFGAEYGLGTQGMVWQYLNGYTPLNYDAAAKFAEGLRCTIKDISPEMDKALRQSILPALGLRAWRPAVVALLSLAFLIQPPPSFASCQNSRGMERACVLSKILKRLIMWLLSPFLPFSDTLIRP